MSKAQRFLQSVMNSSHPKFKLKYVGDAAVSDLGIGNVAKITLTCGRANNYHDRINVQIINNQTGAVDSHDFKFANLKVKINSDNPNASHIASNGLYVDNDYEWFVNAPTSKSVAKMEDEIYNYISLFGV